MGCGSSKDVPATQAYPNVPDGYEEKEGAMYYKSGWCDTEVKVYKKFPPGSTDMVERKMWIQCIHWVVYTYPGHQPWYNWGGTSGPSEEETKGLSLPSIPGLPSGPGMPDLPSVDMPSVDMPSVDMPSIDAPSVDMPSMPSIPGAPDLPSLNLGKPKKRRKDYPWQRYEIYRHGSYEPRATLDGKKITIKGVRVTEYFEEEDDEEEREVIIKCSSEEQALSWLDSFRAGGCSTRPLRCPAGHTYEKSSYNEGNYSGGYVCDNCRNNKSGERWFCKECSSDLCYRCEPEE